MGIQRFKKHLSDSVVNADNASLSSMDTSSFLGAFDDGAADEGDKKAGGGGAKAIARELEKVAINSSVALVVCGCAASLLCTCVSFVLTVCAADGGGGRSCRAG